MIRRNLCTARLELHILSDRGLGGILHVDAHDCHRSCDDAAASGDGMRIGIVIIRRLMHHRAGDELVLSRERCPVRDGDTRGIFGFDLCHGRPHATDADTRRGRECRELRRILRRKCHRLRGELGVLPDFRQDVDRR